MLVNIVDSFVRKEVYLLTYPITLLITDLKRKEV